MLEQRPQTAWHSARCVGESVDGSPGQGRAMPNHAPTAEGAAAVVAPRCLSVKLASPLSCAAATSGIATTSRAVAQIVKDLFIFISPLPPSVMELETFSKNYEDR